MTLASVNKLLKYAENTAKRDAWTRLGLDVHVSGLGDGRTDGREGGINEGRCARDGARPACAVPTVKALFRITNRTLITEPGRGSARLGSTRLGSAHLLSGTPRRLLSGPG